MLLFIFQYIYHFLVAYETEIFVLVWKAGGSAVGVEGST